MGSEIMPETNNFNTGKLSKPEVKKDIFDYEKMEEIYGQVDKYCKNKFSDEIKNEYIDRYGDDSLSFFDKKILKI